MRAHVYPEVWIMALYANMKSDKIVLTDVRYPNEITAVENWGGVHVKVDRGDYTPPHMTEEELNHSSETALLDFDGWNHVIYNDIEGDGFEERLYAQADTLMKSLGLAKQK
jgi:hypothetical protein